MITSNFCRGRDFRATVNVLLCEIISFSTFQCIAFSHSLNSLYVLKNVFNIIQHKY